jgi:hypothetical protein
VARARGVFKVSFDRKKMNGIDNPEEGKYVPLDYAFFSNMAVRAVLSSCKTCQVETVGDCYVAATGLPDPRKDHAIVLAKFARDCLYKFHRLVRQMELVLGYVMYCPENAICWAL